MTGDDMVGCGLALGRAMACVVLHVLGLVAYAAAALVVDVALQTMNAGRLPEHLDMEAGHWILGAFAFAFVWAHVAWIAWAVKRAVREA